MKRSGSCSLPRDSDEGGDIDDPVVQVADEGGHLVAQDLGRATIAGCGKLDRARSRLYQNEIWQENMFDSSRRDLHNALLCINLASIQPRTSPNKFVSSSSRESEFER